MKTQETTLFELYELTDDARENAYKNWLDDYRWSGEYTMDLMYSDTVHYGDKALEGVGMVAEWDSWDNCRPGSYIDPDNGRMTPYLTAADYLPNAENICSMDDYGYWSSMDMADAFNEYSAQLLELVKAYKACEDYDESGRIAEEFARLHKDACWDACRVFQRCYEDEKEDLESLERFEDESTQGYECRTIGRTGRVYYSDCRKWYTEDGEYWGESSINNACVSIVKAS